METFPAAGIRNLYDTPVLDRTDGAPTRPLIHRRDFAERLASADLPTPLHAPLAAIRDPKLRGRWVLAPTYHSDVVERARTGGAVGLLVPRGIDAAGWMPKMIAGQRLPGACDNASGVAVVLEAARLLVPRLPAGVGLAVAFLDGEEVGAQGSAHHAPRVAAGTFVINVDGAADLGNAAAVQSGGPAHSLLAALDQAGRAFGVPLRAGAMPSDNRRAPRTITVD